MYVLSFALISYTKTADNDRVLPRSLQLALHACAQQMNEYLRTRDVPTDTDNMSASPASPLSWLPRINNVPPSPTTPRAHVDDAVDDVHTPETAFRTPLAEVCQMIANFSTEHFICRSLHPIDSTRGTRRWLTSACWRCARVRRRRWRAR